MERKETLLNPPLEVPPSHVWVSFLCNVYKGAHGTYCVVSFPALAFQVTLQRKHLVIYRRLMRTFFLRLPSNSCTVISLTHVVGDLDCFQFLL